MASDTGMAVLDGKRDYDKVKRDLQAAGYKGEKVVLIVPADFPIIKVASDVSADMMKRVGMDVDYQALDWGTVLQRRASKNPPAQGGWNAFCTGFNNLDFATPATHQPLRGNGGQAWFGWPTNPQMEALRDEWFEAADLAGQQRIASEIQAQAFEDVPYFALGGYNSLSAYRADLTKILHSLPLRGRSPRQFIRS